MSSTHGVAKDVSSSTPPRRLSDVKHTEDVENTKEVDSNRAASSEEEEIVHVTPKTWLVISCMSLGYGLSFYCIPVMAAIGPAVSAELGNPGKSIWFISGWNFALTVVFLLGGANTDLLGRRWFLVLGNMFSVVGNIIIGATKSADAAVAGMVIIGIGAGLCQMANFALAELLPNKWRHTGVVLSDAVTSILIVVSPIAARFGMIHGTWRWNFYGCAIGSFISFLGLYFIYHPPAQPLNKPWKEVLKELDYLGAALFLAGACPMLIGIVWSAQYTGADPHIIAPICVGAFFLLLFALWETYGNVTHPLTPTYIFTSSHGRDFTAPLIVIAIANMYFYSQNILWPTMISAFYTNGGENWRHAMALSSVQGTAIIGGSIGLVLFGSRIKHWQWQLTGVFSIMVTFGALAALGSPSNKAAMIACAYICGFAFTWALFLAIAISQLGVAHENLGLSGGLAGTFRNAAGVIGTSVYTAILSRTTSSEISKLVPKAALGAGLPESSLEELMSIVGTPALAENFSPAITRAVQGAYLAAQQQGIRTLALSSIAFGGVGIIACMCCKDVDAKMTNSTEVFLENDIHADKNHVH